MCDGQRQNVKNNTKRQHGKKTKMTKKTIQQETFLFSHPPHGYDPPPE
jgi:hypothetical protein